VTRHIHYEIKLSAGSSKAISYLFLNMFCNGVLVKLVEPGNKLADIRANASRVSLVAEDTAHGNFPEIPGTGRARNLERNPDGRTDGHG